MEKLSLFAYWLRCYTQNFANFSGRARRSEYWGFVLFNMIVLLPINVYNQVYIIGQALAGYTEPTMLIGGSVLLTTIYYVWSLVSFLPGLAVSVRRMHDTGRSGWFVLVGLIPLVGWILLLVWYCTDSAYGTNQYGPNPKYPEQA